MNTSAVASSLPEGSKVIKGLRYVKNGSDAQALDLYLPPESNLPAPIIVWIHGGGWHCLDRTSEVPVSMLAGGYAVASLDYRLTGEATFPAQIHDCKAAVRFLRAHADAYRLDPNRIGAWGHSAGGHLAALLGLSAGVPELEGPGGHADQPSHVQCVVDYAGINDLRTHLQQVQASTSAKSNLASAEEITTKLLGSPIPERPDLAQAASPAFYVSTESPPFLLLHGTADERVPIEQARDLHHALQAAGRESTLITYEGAVHWEPTPEMEKQVRTFFDRHLK